MSLVSVPASKAFLRTCIWAPALQRPPQRIQLSLTGLRELSEGLAGETRQLEGQQGVGKGVAMVSEDGRGQGVFAGRKEESHEKERSEKEERR